MGPPSVCLFTFLLFLWYGVYISSVCLNFIWCCGVVFGSHFVIGIWIVVMNGICENENSVFWLVWWKCWFLISIYFFCFGLVYEIFCFHLNVTGNAMLLEKDFFERLYKCMKMINIYWFHWNSWEWRRCACQTQQFCSLVYISLMKETLCCRYLIVLAGEFAVMGKLG